MTHSSAARAATVVIAACSALAGVAVAGLKEGITAHDSGDFSVALREFTPLAEQGNLEAQYRLGLMHAEGQGTPQDYRAALAWFRKAAEANYGDAQISLGIMYEQGLGIPRDYEAAVGWYRKAAEQEKPGAQNAMRAMLRRAGTRMRSRTDRLRPPE